MTVTKEELESMLSAFKSDIAETFKTQMSDTLKEVDKKNGGTAAALTKEFQKTAESLKTQLTGEVNNTPEVTPEAAPVPANQSNDNSASVSEKLSLKALQNQIESLRQEREQQEVKIAKQNRDSEINSLFNNRKAQFSDRATKAFLMENENKLKQEDGIWYHAEGENVVPLDKAVDTFLSSDFGTTFMPASRGRGMNMKPNKGTDYSSKNTEISLNESLLQPDGE